jgi:hypothetical protein
MKFILILVFLFGIIGFIEQTPKEQLFGVWKTSDSEERRTILTFIDSSKMTMELEPYPAAPLYYSSEAHGNLIILKISAKPDQGGKHEITALAQLVDANQMKLQVFNDTISHFQFEDNSKDGDPVIYKRVTK